MATNESLTCIYPHFIRDTDDLLRVGIVSHIRSFTISAYTFCYLLLFGSNVY